MALALMIIPEHSSSSPPPPIKGKKKQESSPIMFEKKLNAADSNPCLKRAASEEIQGNEKDDNEMAPNWVADTSFLLFEKTLECGDTLLFFPRLVIESCKDEVKEALDKRLKGKDLAAYVCASTIDRWRRSYNLRVSRFENEGGWGYFIHHEWGDVVTANGLKKGDKIWCWGRILHNSGIQMKIEVDRCG